jgi:hypothetical protein
LNGVLQTWVTRTLCLPLQWRRRGL